MAANPYDGPADAWKAMFPCPIGVCSHTLNAMRLAENTEITAISAHGVAVRVYLRAKTSATKRAGKGRAGSSVG